MPVLDHLLTIGLKLSGTLTPPMLPMVSRIQQGPSPLSEAPRMTRSVFGPSLRSCGLPALCLAPKNSAPVLSGRAF